MEPYSPLSTAGNYEMGNMNAGAQAPAAGAGGSLQDFYAEVDDIRNAIDTINANIQRIETLHGRALTDIDEGNMQQTERQLEAVSAETSQLNNSTANRIKILKSKAGSDPSKAPQATTLDRNFKTALRKYQMVEKTYADRTREQMARQFRIVRPDATEEEVQQACEDGSGQQIFSQEVRR